MIWTLDSGASQKTEMSSDKRPRSSASRDSNATILVIDDDEEPPRKRQRSTTPVTKNSFQTHVQRVGPAIISVPSSPEPSSQRANSSATGGEPVTKRPSPWKSRPSRVKNASAISVSSSDESSGHDELARWLSNEAAVRESKKWTNNDTRRMRELSISLGKETLPSSNNTASIRQSSSHHIATNNVNSANEEDKTLLDKFKLGSSHALKFNPNSKAPISLPVNHNHSSPSRFGQKLQHKSALTLHSKQLPQQVVHSVSVPKLASQHPTNHIRVPAQTVPDKSQLPGSLSVSKPPTQKLGPQLPQQHYQISRLSVNVPLTEKARVLRERQAFQEKLKHGVEYARQNLEEVMRVLGLTDVSIGSPADLDEQKCRSAAQPKKRMVERNKISLEIGQLNLVDTSSRQDAEDCAEMIHPRDLASAVLTARFSERFNPPLTFVNDINDKRLNGKFQFISEYFLGYGVRVSGTVGRAGCACAGKCDASCQCLQRIFKVDKPKSEWSEQVQQYERLPNGQVVLRDDFIKRHMIQVLDDEDAETEGYNKPQRIEISECNDFCSCDDTCVNRVVQKGRTVPLEIFETGRCGFGVRSTVDLVRGQFIENYLGEVITERELNRREDAAEAGSTSYIYSLDWFSSYKTPYHVDGQNFGSAMRFVNHSCDPNAGTFVVLNNRATKQLHQVAFFALKDIPAGTEITIDYTPQAVGTTYELKAADEGMEKCYCGAKNCRQMLWPPGKERKARKRILGNNFD